MTGIGLALFVAFVAYPAITHADVEGGSLQMKQVILPCIRDRMITVNPVTRTRVPPQMTPAAEMLPLSRSELEEVRDDIARLSPVLADAVWLAGWTGLRWSELREVRVGDFIADPVPRLIVRRAQPEGIGTKRPKSGKARHIPLVDAVLPLVRQMSAGKAADDLLVTTENGARLYATAFKRTTDWKLNGRGRRLHDLRHTAACLWLEAGVSPTNRPGMARARRSDDDAALPALPRDVRG